MFDWLKRILSPPLPEGQYIREANNPPPTTGRPNPTPAPPRPTIRIEWTGPPIRVKDPVE